MGKIRPYQSYRTRQRLSLKMIAFSTAYSLFLITTGVVIFINLSHVEKTMAQAVSKYTVEEQTFVIDKALPTTVSKQHPLFGSHTQFLRKAKAINANETNISER